MKALEAAIAMARGESAGRAQQIDSMLTTRTWQEVAEFAAYCCQTESLDLKPWEWPPIWITDIEDALSQPEDARRIRSAALLLQTMLRAGLSKWEPNPLGALDQVEARKVAR
jgi:hypothetical protein